MKFGYTIIYTEDVVKSIEFFENAFGFKRRFIHESGYGELETGETALAFASHELGKNNLPNGYIKANEEKRISVYDWKIVPTFDGQVSGTCNNIGGCLKNCNRNIIGNLKLVLVMAPS